VSASAREKNADLLNLRTERSGIPLLSLFIPKYSEQPVRRDAQVNGLCSTLSQNHFHAVMRNGDFDPAFVAHGPKTCGNFSFVSGHNLRAAMGDDHSPNVLFLAPTKLRLNGRVPDKTIAPFADERSRERGAVADVYPHILQRCRAIVNENKVRPVEDARASRTYTVSHRWSKDRVLDRKGLECDAADFCPDAFPDDPTIVDLAGWQRLPGFPGREYRAGRTPLQAPGMIGMRMRKHDRIRMQSTDFAQPIKPAVDHHFSAAIRHSQGSMHAVTPRARVDLAARAEKSEFHVPSTISGEVRRTAGLFQLFRF
jgi:hypothetical protein